MQRINLFRAEFLPQPIKFSLRRVLQGLPLVLALLLGIGLYLQKTVRSEQALSALARTDLDTVLQQIAALQPPPSGPGTPDQSLPLSQQIEQASALLQSLRLHQNDSRAGFAALLQTLAENHDEQIWLTRIRIGANALQLAGATVQAERLPIWLARLQSTPSLRGRRFAGLHIVREDDSPLLHFDLNGAELYELSAAQAQGTGPTTLSERKP